MTRFFGRPYPVQFRAQGALDAWTQALGHTGLWPLWQDPGTLCWQIRQEILRQLECMHPSSSVAGQISPEDRQRLAFQVSTNLKYHLSAGTVIEATAALETLLANSDVDLSLPMGMVAPPYRAQYLRFGETAMRYLKVPSPQAADHFFDGAFCFLTRHRTASDPEGKCWTLELVFISKRQDRYGGHIGHFRMQPFGAANQQRKLIFVAPVLIHAEQLQENVPAPKPYRAGAAVASTT